MTARSELTAWIALVALTTIGFFVSMYMRYDQMAGAFGAIMFVMNFGLIYAIREYQRMNKWRRL